MVRTAFISSNKSGSERGFEGVFGVAVFLVWSIFLTEPANAQRPQIASELVPAETVAFLSVPNLDVLLERFSVTELGALAADPEASEFSKDLWNQLHEKFVGDLGQGGLALEDLKSVRSGEVSFAVLVANGRPVSVLLVDVLGNEEPTDVMLEKVASNLELRNAKEESSQTLFGAKVRSFLLPHEVGEIRRPKVQFTSYKGWLVVSSELAGMEQVLQQFNEENTQASLGSHAPFVRVVERLIEGRESSGGEDSEPQIAWYVSPFKLAESIKNEQNIPSEVFKYIDAMSNSGFSSIEAIGGDVRFDREDWDVEFQTFAVVPGASSLDAVLSDSARMLPFEIAEAPPAISPFARATSATVMAGTWNFGTAFSASEPLVDRIFDPGMFARVLNDLRYDEGTQVDLRQLATELGPGFTFSTEIVPPYEPGCEKVLVSVQLNRPDLALENLANYLNTDGYVETAILGGGIKAWEYEVVVNEDQLPFPIDEPVGVDVEEEEVAPFIAIVAVIGNEIVASNDVEYLKSLVDGTSNTSITSDAEFRRVIELLKARSPGVPTIVRFGRPDRIYRLTYELMQSNKLTSTHTYTFVERVLRLIDGTEKGSVRRSYVDATKLPKDFEKTVAPRLLPSGWAMTVEKDGWYIVGGVLAPVSK